MRSGRDDQRRGQSVVRERDRGQRAESGCGDLQAGPAGEDLPAQAIVDRFPQLADAEEQGTSGVHAELGFAVDAVLRGIR